MSVIYGLGPKAQWVYTVLRERLNKGELQVGARLPSHNELAEEFGVALLTVRQVLARLEEEGLVSREQGRGTFVRERVAPGVLIVEDDAPMNAFLRTHITRAGHRAITATNPVEGLAAMESDPHIALVLSDVRMPTPETGIAFIRAIRTRWPNIPVAALTGYPQDLTELLGTPESPILILPKPVWPHQIDEALRLAL